MIILRWLRILSIVNDSITFTDYQKTLFYLISCIVQVWKVENSFSLQNSVVFAINLKLTFMKGIYVHSFYTKYEAN